MRPEWEGLAVALLRLGACESELPIMIDLDHEIQTLRDLAQRDVVPMSRPEATATRGF
jgi:hypothetical protein